MRRPSWHIASSIARRDIPVAISSSSRSYIQPPHLSNRAELSPMIQARTSRLTREPEARPARGINGAQSSAPNKSAPPTVVYATSLTRENGKKGTRQREPTKAPKALSAVFSLSAHADAAVCFQWKSAPRQTNDSATLIRMRLYMKLISSRIDRRPLVEKIRFTKDSSTIGELLSSAQHKIIDSVFSFVFRYEACHNFSKASRSNC